jgi:hypothetical protein
MVASDGLKKGVWVTFASSATIPNSDLTNNGGNNPSSDNYYAAFVSRGSHAQFDNCDFTGSSGGVRAARSIVSARAAKYDNIPGKSVYAFDGGIVTATGSSFTGSGAGGPRWILVAAESIIRAAGSSFNQAAGVIAYVVNGGDIAIDSCTGVDIERPVVFAENGRAGCSLSTFSVSASNWHSSSTELFTGGVGATIQVVGGSYNGSGAARNLGRAVGNARIALNNLASSGFTENAIARIQDSGEIFASGSTHNGSADVMLRGSNANGELVRYANGVQECWTWLEVTNIATPKVMARTWTFPAAFAHGVLTIVVTGTTSVRNPSNAVVTSTRNKLKDTQLLSSAVSPGNSEFLIEINSSASTEFVTGDTCWIRAHAIGRWF